MVSTGLKVGSALLCIAAIPAISGCANCQKRANARGMVSTRTRAGSSERDRPSRHGVATRDRANRDRMAMRGSSISDGPPHAKPGECYAPVYRAAVFDTVTERVLVREESERIEIIPAEFKVVEERVMVKEPTTRLVAVPAEFDVQDRVVQTRPAHSAWVKADEHDCEAAVPGAHLEGVYCLLSEPGATTTIPVGRLVNGPSVREVNEPAEYEIIRKRKLVRPPSTRRVTIPAEYRDVTKTVMIAPAKMEWVLVDCDSSVLTIQ